MSYDIVISHGPGDDNILPYTISQIRKFVKGEFRNIYIITHDAELDIFEEEVFVGCKVIDEKTFPFLIQDVDKFIQTPKRNGWYLQQLIKLYASLVIEDMLDDYVVIDADTLFLKDISFKSGERYMFNMGDEHHIPYFEHMKRVHPSFEKMVKFSGISHHMIFNRMIISEMMMLVERHHNLTPFWEVFLREVSPEHRHASGASEYEMYFNYMLKNHKDKLIPRKIRFENTALPADYILSNFQNLQDGPYYASLHGWMVNRQPRQKVKNCKEGHFILVYIGQLRDFVYECIKQIKLWNPTSTIHLCINNNDHNKPYIEGLKEDVNIVYIEDLEMTYHHKIFVQRYTNMSMNGFWRYTMERFFVVEEAMRKLNLKNVFHLEIDNMIYFKVDEILEKCKSIDKILIPSDSERRYIAGTCFINNPDSLNRLNRYFTEHCVNKDEMHSIMSFTNIYNEVGTLPVLPPGDNTKLIYEYRRHLVDDIKRISKHSELFGGVFDAAAVGQGIFGIDWRVHSPNNNNTDGFVNKDSIFDFSRIWFKWLKEDGKLQRLYMSLDKELFYPIFNLHIHSKDLFRCLSDITEMTKHLPNIL